MPLLIVLAMSMLHTGSTISVLSEKSGKYDPVKLLCPRGKAFADAGKIPKWCPKWLECIETGAKAGMDAAAVEKAWEPVECEEFCGKWPASKDAKLLLLEGQGPVVTSNASAKASLMSKLEQLGTLGLVAESVSISTRRRKKPGCMESCANFKKTFSTCVAAVLFKPGTVPGADGVATKEKAKKPPAVCEAKETPCMPSLPYKYQKCVMAGCKELKQLRTDYEECKDCPQLATGAVDRYESFIGGCHDQLHAYHQATMPDAGPARIPGAKGCSVHAE